jgi:hypothetical protein
MPRSFSLGNGRALFAALAVLPLGLGFATGVASAETFPANCSTLQAQITVASGGANHGEGQVVVLDGLCSVGVMIPTESNITIEGAAGTTSGFDGAGASGAFISSGSVGAVTLADLTFENAKSTTAPAVKLFAQRAILRDDVFKEDTLEGGHGAGADIETSSCVTPPSVPVVSVTGSSFTGEKLTQTGLGGGGGALYIGNGCIGSTTVLDGNSFEGDTLEGPSTAELVGGALEFAGVGGGTFPVSQEHNVFDSNRILTSAGGGNRGGGGEWLQGASLTSVADRFSRNAIPGTTGAQWSWGGGLGIINTSCNSKVVTESVLEDDVIAGNSIGAGSPADLGGAGMYVGCPPEPGYPNHLRLRDSTVTENTVAGTGGVAGIDGHSSDQLAIENSIVALNNNGPEIGGFNGEVGSLTSVFSDVCDEAGTAPLPGEGNICANPLLADNGNPYSSDVHETAASPTIDAGSNALVPGGLTTDAFGTTRILPGRAGCTGSLPAVVDIGAAEFQPGVPSCPPPTPKPPPGLTHFVRLKTNATGAALTLSCTSTDGLGCSGMIFITTDELLHGKKIVGVSLEGHTKVSVRLAQTSFSLAAGSTATFQVKLNATGLKLLRRFHAFPTFLIANEASPTSDPFIFLFHMARFSEPRKQSKKHHPHRPKHPAKHPKHH